MSEPSSRHAVAPGNTAVITGGASGIGLAAAKRFAALGMKVCLVDHAEGPLAAAAAEIDDAVLTVVADVADPAAMQAAAERVRAELGQVSLLMNNAGIGGGGDVFADVEGWHRIISVNLLGMLHGVQSFVPAMIAGHAPGLVINTGSKQGITQPPGNTAYNVSKAGVKALTEGLAHSLLTATDGRVSAHLLIPGFTYTGMIEQFLPERPPAAWTPEQVIDRLLEAIDTGDFYILCPDNETTRAEDEKRILWAANDLVENRPALSRWHPDWKERYAAYIAGE